MQRRLFALRQVDTPLSVTMYTRPPCILVMVACLALLLCHSLALSHFAGFLTEFKMRTRSPVANPKESMPAVVETGLAVRSIVRDAGCPKESMPAVVETGLAVRSIVRSSSCTCSVSFRTSFISWSIRSSPMQCLGRGAQLLLSIK